MSVNVGLLSTNNLTTLLCLQSMPSLEEASEFSSSELDGEYKEQDTPCPSSNSFGEQQVSIPAVLAVICHRLTKMRDDSPLPPGCMSQQEHTEV